MSFSRKQVISLAAIEQVAKVTRSSLNAGINPKKTYFAKPTKQSTIEFYVNFQKYFVILFCSIFFDFVLFDFTSIVVFSFPNYQLEKFI